MSSSSMPPGSRREEGFVVGNSGKTVVVSPIYSRCRLREKSSKNENISCSIYSTNGDTISRKDFKKTIKNGRKASEIQ